MQKILYCSPRANASSLVHSGKGCSGFLITTRPCQQMRKQNGGKGNSQRQVKSPIRPFGFALSQPITHTNTQKKMTCKGIDSKPVMRQTHKGFKHERSSKTVAKMLRWLYLCPDLI
jgi:hypothetical protein